jgi:hypothetical protein
MHTAKHIFTLFILLLLFQTGNSQVDSVYTGNKNDQNSKKRKPDPKNPDWFKQKISYGGFITPSYGVSTYGSLLSVSANPNIGYRVTDRMTLGVGGYYYYTSLKTSVSKYSQSLYGPSVFGRYKILTNAFFQLEYAKMNQPDYYSANDTRVWVNYFYVGGGYFQSMGNGNGVVLSIKYNLIPSPNSSFLNYMFNIGFVRGF